MPPCAGLQQGHRAQPWHRAHLVLPTGLIPKDYRSLKTQYLQVRGPGSHCRATAASDGGSPPCALATRQWAAALLGMGSASTGRLCLQGRLCYPRLQLPLPCACWGGGSEQPVPRCRGDTLCASRAHRWGSTLIWLPHSQSYGPEHLLTFHNLKRIGLLTEQSAGDTLTAVESKVSKLVTDRAAGEPAPALCPWEPGKGSCCCRSGWKHVEKVWARSTKCVSSNAAAGRALLWGQQGWQPPRPFSRAHSSAHLCQPGLGSRQSLLRCFSLSCFPGKITDAFNSLARKSNFRAISKKLGLVGPQAVLAGPQCPQSRELALACACAQAAGLAPQGDTDQGQSCCSCSRQPVGFSLGLGATASFPLCPDPAL